MRPSSRRSSSLQRTSRAGSAKRGQRASTPSRRLSDLPERPAWDATSSNLDKFKLTAEEQERRKASRVSKNRPLASDTSRRSFVEAWAKHVTAGVLKQDTAHDQDRPRSSPSAGDLPINYSSVVDMLRKSPQHNALNTTTTPVHGDGQERARQEAGALGASGAERDAEDPSRGTDVLRAHQQGSAASATAAVLAEEPSEAPLLSYGFAATVCQGARRHGQGSGEGREDQERRRSGAAAAAATAATTTAATAAALENAGPAGGGGAVHRADVSITPVGLRPRFNPAEATTIIAFGGDSDEEEEDGGEGEGGEEGPQGSPGAAAERDPMTAAFEAALFGRGLAQTASAGPAGIGAAGSAGNALPLAWAASRGGGGSASHVGVAAGEVERRLRALETALASGAAGGGSALLQEDVAELRLELRKVQQDNAKLRQELSTFSTHASALLTQLQAQVHQLLRVSGPGVPVSITAVVPTQPNSALYQPHQQPQIHQPLQPQPQPQPFPAPLTQVGEGLTGAHSSRTAPFQPHQPQQSAPHMPLLREPLPQQPLARRNIFADLDPSVLRPLGQVKAGPGGGAEAAGGSTVGTPHAVYGGSRLPDMIAPAPAAAAPPSSPLIDVISMPLSSYAPHPAPSGSSNLDEAEVALPSFAAFRRSAGAAAFTSARPATAGLHAPPTASPNNTARAGAAVTAASGREGAGTTSPAPAPTALPARSFPTQYQPRSLGGVVVRPGSSTLPGGSAATAASNGPSLMKAAAAAAAASAATATSGAYAAAAAADAAAASATASDVAAAALARAHTGLPQPLVFSVGPEFRAVRATGLSAENSMSLSAHTAAAAAARSKSSAAAPVPAR